ncbi:MAG: TetR/AcrR family transcriptional regulator, partial [Alphaproteobacteria bacterium]
MRYAPDHKPATRARIVAAAGRVLLDQGLAGTGVHQVMARAGLTHGGFYGHFQSRDALIAEALEALLEERRGQLVAGLDELRGEARLAQVVGRYLNRHHRDNAAAGCPLPALGGELARADPELRARFERGLAALADEIAAPRDEDGAPQPAGATADAIDGAGAGAGPGASLEERALATLALCAGGVMLSRAVGDGELSDRILRAC